jgi:hypothetical protein
MSVCLEFLLNLFPLHFEAFIGKKFKELRISLQNSSIGTSEYKVWLHTGDVKNLFIDTYVVVFRVCWEFIYLYESVCMLQQDAKIMLNYGPNRREPRGKGWKGLLDVVYHGPTRNEWWWWWWWCLCSHIGQLAEIVTKILINLIDCLKLMVRDS